MISIADLGGLPPANTADDVVLGVSLAITVDAETCEVYEGDLVPTKWSELSQDPEFAAMENSIDWDDYGVSAPSAVNGVVESQADSPASAMSPQQVNWGRWTTHTKWSMFDAPGIMLVWDQGRYTFDVGGFGQILNSISNRQHHADVNPSNPFHNWTELTESDTTSCAWEETCLPRQISGKLTMRGSGACSRRLLHSRRTGTGGCGPSHEPTAPVPLRARLWANSP